MLYSLNWDTVYKYEQYCTVHLIISKYVDMQCLNSDIIHIYIK